MSLLEKIGQILKGFLGGTDNAEEHRVQAARMKFLYYGEAHELLNHGQRERLQNRTRYSPQRLDPTIKRLFKEIGDHVVNWNHAEKSGHLKRLREIVTDYHRRHASSLQPGWWSRLFIPPFIDPKNILFFGDTPLELSRKALKQEKPNPYLAFIYLQRAFDVKNDSPQFQKRLAEQLQELEDLYRPELQDQHRKIQELWTELAQISFENGDPVQARSYLVQALQTDPSHSKERLEVGKVYLINKEYKLAQSFLPELKKAFAQDRDVQIEIGHAYWQFDEFEEAISAYETALKCPHKTVGRFSSSQKQMAFIYHRMGTAYSENKISVSQSNSAKAIQFFTTAVKNDSSEEEYQENLYSAYAHQWEAFPDNFAAAYGQEWLQFLNICKSTIIEKWSDKLTKMLLNCSEQFFKAHQNQKTHACFEKIFQLFPERADLKIEVLDLAIRYGDWTPLEPKFAEWVEQNYANPYLKKKIGDAYWSTHQGLAVESYRDSLDLFTQLLSHCPDDERLTCQHHIADMQAKIGQKQLQTQPGLFRSVPYDEALQRLEKAAGLHPSLHASSFFDACLSAAQAEKQRSKPFRDTNKIISYFQKAFQIRFRKGDYLIELMQLYLDSKRFDEAIILYYGIQKQPWSEELALPAKVFSELANKLFERKDYELSLACHKKAFKLEPKNQKYKQNYFQLAFMFANDQYHTLQRNKAQEEEKKRLGSLSKLLEILKDCWDAGFQNVEKSKASFQEIIAKIYGSLATCYVERCLLPAPASEMEKNDVRRHKREHEKDIFQALKNYDLGLKYQPESASLHFDKGLLLDWQTQFEEAIEEYELAIQYQPRNPFYHKLLGSLYYVVSYDSEKKERHMELAQSYASANFENDYQIWKTELMCKSKTKEIDPHSYTMEKSGWF